MKSLRPLSLEVGQRQFLIDDVTKFNNSRAGPTAVSLVSHPLPYPREDYLPAPYHPGG